MRRVLIDATVARRGGALTYLRNILPALARRAPQLHFRVLLSSVYQVPLIDSLPPGVEAAPLPVPADSLRRGLFLRRCAPELVARHGIDVWVSISEVTLARPPCRHVVVSRNMKMFLPFGELVRLTRSLGVASRRLSRACIVRSSLCRADRVVFPSEALRSAALRRVAIAPQKTCVIHHGIDPLFMGSNEFIGSNDGARIGGNAGERGGGGAAERMSDDTGGRSPGEVGKRGDDRANDYVLTVGHIAPHKNLGTLVRAFGAVARANGDGLQLLLAGDLVDRRLTHALRRLARSQGIESRVRFLGRVEPERLRFLYRGARAFVQPSRIEAFSHPLLEAMASGVPVVASDIPTCHEACGEAALYFAPDDDTHLAAALSRLLGEPETVQWLRRAGVERTSRYSWDEAAVRLARVFEEVGAQ